MQWRLIIEPIVHGSNLGVLQSGSIALLPGGVTVPSTSGEIRVLDMTTGSGSSSIVIPAHDILSIRVQRYTSATENTSEEAVGFYALDFQLA